MTEYNENLRMGGKSGYQIIQELGKRYALYRKRMKLTQKQVAEHSGLSIYTISCFENGTQTGLTIASFIKLLRAIDYVDEMAKLLPQLPPSPREIYLKQHKLYHKENNR